MFRTGLGHRREYRCSNSKKIPNPLDFHHSILFAAILLCHLLKNKISIQKRKENRRKLYLFSPKSLKNTLRYEIELVLTHWGFRELPPQYLPSCSIYNSNHIWDYMSKPRCHTWATLSHLLHISYLSHLSGWRPISDWYRNTIL